MAGITISPASSSPSATSATIRAAPKSISCPPDRSRSCRLTGQALVAGLDREARARPRASSRSSEDEFHAELEQRFGLHLGEIKALDKPRAFPLGYFVARSFIGERLALVGDAAHVIHPIAGQGLNMGLKDVAALAEVVVDAARLGMDLGPGRRARSLPALAAVRHHGDGACRPTR